jgi:hypothetical protein
LTPAQHGGTYVNVMNIYITSSAMEASVSFAAALNDVPRPFWIVAMVLAFAWHWPIGLLVLGFLLGRRHWRRQAWGPGCWYNTAEAGAGARQGSGWGWGPGMFDWGSRGASAPPSSGNNAFDDYRAETLRRLEEEQKEFQEYLDRLRRARDKAEFDQFMADRRFRPAPPPEPGQPV